MQNYLKSVFHDELDDSVVHRNSIGGHPILPEDQEWPICGQSGKKMILFFQFDIDPKFGLPLPPNSHFSAFMSSKVNDVPLNDFFPDDKPMPERFWEQYGSHMKVFLHQNMSNEKIHECDQYLKYKKIEFNKMIDKPKCDQILIGCPPLWKQFEERPKGPNSEELFLICQLTYPFDFEKREHAPSQVHYESDYYWLFAGAHIYFFCYQGAENPEAIYVTSQKG